MKIIGTKMELDWIEKELPRLDNCFIDTECALISIPYRIIQQMTDRELKEVCKKCVEENVGFEIEERPEK